MMAVEDKYVSADLIAGKLANPAYMQGAATLSLVATFEVAAADDDGSVYRIANLNPNLIPIDISINCDAITGGTDYDLGLYEPGVGGVVIDKDVFMDGTDISGGAAIGSEINGLSAVAIENLYRKIYEHGGQSVTDYKDGYDLAFTANTVGTAAGTITTRATFIRG